MSKEQELLKAIDQNGEIGFLDLATKPAGAAANEVLFAVRLGDGATIFIDAERLTAIASDKFHFLGSFAGVRRDPNQTPLLGNKE